MGLIAVLLQVLLVAPAATHACRQIRPPPLRQACPAPSRWDGAPSDRLHRSFPSGCSAYEVDGAQ